MSTRISGGVNSVNRGRLDDLEAHNLVANIWRATVTATQSFTATTHPTTTAITVTMGVEAGTIAVQALKADSTFEISTDLFHGATGGTTVMGLFWGTATSPFHVTSQTLNFTGGGLQSKMHVLYDATGTATANIALRVLGTSNNTIYINSNTGGENFAGQQTSYIIVKERLAT